MKKHLAIICWAANPAAPELCATPFFHAAAAAAMDVDVEVYFTGSSIQLLKKGVADGLVAGPEGAETVAVFMRQAAAHGARLFACAQAMAVYGLQRADLIDETAGVAGAAAYVARGLEEDWLSVVY